MLKSSHLTLIATLVGLTGVVAGIGALSIDSVVGFAVWVTFFMLVVLVLFGAAVLRHLELLTASSNTSAEDAESRKEYTVPRRPKHNERQWSAALQEIKETGFKSTSKLKMAGYLIALDSVRQEWVIIPPDGDGAKTYAYRQYQGCEINEDEDGNKKCYGLEVKVLTDDGAPIHIVLFDRDTRVTQTYPELKSQAGEIVRLLDGMRTLA